MKKVIYIVPVLMFLVVFYGFLKMSQQDPNADASPVVNSEVSTTESDTIRPAGFPFPTVFNFNCASVPNMNAGTVGAMYLFGQYYFNRWNLTQTYKYDNTGPAGGPGTLTNTYTYIGSCRDLTTNGRYLYAGQAAATLFKFDTNMATVATFSIAGGQFRANAWDPSRNGFWNSNFAGNIICHDTASVVKGTITTSLAAKYGLGFDSLLAGDTAFLWVWDQGTGTANGLHKIRIQTGTSLASYNFTLISGLGIAGGAEVVVYPGTPPRQMLLLNYQNYALVGYKMRDVLVAVENEQGIIRDFALNQNFPNPFNPVTKITFNLMKLSKVNLVVHDASGNRVATLINEAIPSGTHTVDFNASNLASGVYFYTLTVGNFKDTKKMVLVK